MSIAYTQFTVGSGFGALGLVYDGTHIWAVLPLGGSSLAPVLSKINPLTGSYTQLSSSLAGYALCSDGTNLWMTCGTLSNHVVKINISTGAIVGTYATGNDANDVLFDGTYIWIVNSNDGTLTQLLASTGALQGTFATGLADPSTIAFDGTNLWVASASTAFLVKMSTAGSVIGTFAATTSPCIYFDGTYIWLGSSAGIGIITKINLSGTTVATYTTSATGACAIHSDGTNLWVLFNGGTVLVATYNPATGAFLDTSPALPGFPTTNLDSSQFMVWDGTYMWISSFGDPIVTRLKSAAVANPLGNVAY